MDPKRFEKFIRKHFEADELQFTSTTCVLLSTRGALLFVCTKTSYSKDLVYKTYEHISGVSTLRHVTCAHVSYLMRV